jgi:DNA-directed RNA polymerase specialized sigma24 family protein
MLTQSLETWLAHNYKCLEKIVSYLCYQYGISVQDSEDCVHEAIERLLKKNYRVTYPFTIVLISAKRRVSAMLSARERHQDLLQHIPVPENADQDENPGAMVPWARLQREAKTYVKTLVDGYSVADVGTLFNVSRHRVYRVVKRDLNAAN